MSDTPLQRLADLGQSVWYDYIRRDMVDSELAEMIGRDSLAGMTSNPSIFQKAIAGSDLYDGRLSAVGGDDAEAAYEAVAIEDVQAACDVFKTVYDGSGGRDGYVSLEVSPLLADDTEATISAAQRLWDAVARPNCMIKIPGTIAGLPAITATLAAGINVNVTLLFSIERHAQVIEAYMAGLEQRLEAGGSIANVDSVASFFVSRVDSKVDAALREVDTVASKVLLHKIAIANAVAAYGLFQEKFAGERWEALAAKGANLQRPLWASTSTKDPSLPDTYYVEALIGPNTVNTVPPNTYEAFRQHGEPATRIGDPESLKEARSRLSTLAALGVDLAEITAGLEADGVSQFADSYRALLVAVAEKRAALQPAR